MEKKAKNYVLRGLLLGAVIGLIIGLSIQIPGEYYLSLVGRVATTSLKEDAIGWKDRSAALIILIVCFASIGSAVGSTIQYIHLKRTKNRDVVKELLAKAKKEEAKHFKQK